MASSGFNFGALGGPAGGGFSFGGQKTTAPTLSVPSLTQASSSLSFNLAPKTTAATGATGAGGFNFNLPAKTTSGFSFGLGLGGAAPPTTTTGGLTIGGAAAATTSAPSAGFSFGLTPAAAATTSAPSAGFSFGLTPATTAATSTAPAGFTLGATSSAPATGFSFGTTTTSAAPTTGFSLGGTTSTASGGLSGFSFGTTATTAPSLGLGGLGGTTTSTAGSIFGLTTSAPATTGLGGLDPKTSTAGTGGTGAGSGSDGKALKESSIPDQLVTTVDEMQTYVKAEKGVREDIVRMSSKPIVRVQEDIAALKQLLSVVSNGLQRNACTLDKLKAEMTQELKNAEMAQRTKDIPPGLQYENTAPNEYFEQLVEQFEGRMLSYRQQIETLENHLSALQQPVRHSPAEIFTLIKRLHETFIGLAAQLQQVHETMKAQKEQFLTYRRVFLGDTKDIFQPMGMPATSRPAVRRPQDTSGPTPFPGITNAAAAAMASVLNRPQQPHGPPVAGLLGSTGTGTSWLCVGGSGLGTTGGLLGTTGSSSLLAQPGSLGGTGFGTSSMFSFGTGSSGTSTTTTNNNSLASTLGSLNNTANASLNVSAATKQPFTLQKPPPGAKRGKR